MNRLQDWKTTKKLVLFYCETLKQCALRIRMSTFRLLMAAGSILFLLIWQQMRVQEYPNVTDVENVNHSMSIQWLCFQRKKDLRGNEFKTWLGRECPFLGAEQLISASWFSALF